MTDRRARNESAASGSLSFELLLAGSPPALALSVSLSDALRRASPRHLPRTTPFASLAVHGAVAVVWVLLFLSAFEAGGIYAWSAGIAYIVYDTVLLAFVGWKTLALLRPSPVVEPAERERIGMIIAAHNEAAVLPQTIPALFAQDDPPDVVIIADDGSTDGTAELLVARFGFVLPELGAWARSTTQPSLYWLRLPHGGKARALNVALQPPDPDCATPIVMTVDADTHLSTSAVGAMRRAFSADRSLVAATGILKPVCGPSIVGRCFEWFQTYEYIRNFLSRYAWMRMDSLLLISGAFAGFRLEAVVTVGGFDEHCLVEDYELIHRLMRHAALHDLGWHSAVIGAAQAQTEAPSAIAPFLRQRRRWFGGFLQTQYWYRAMVGDGRRYGNVGRWMLPVKAIDTMQPIFGLTALAILFVSFARGHFGLLVPASAWILAKIAIDLAFHLWSVHLYRRWVGRDSTVGAGASFGYALAAALAEPFSFQVLRHLGAALGWVTFLTRQRGWGKQERLAVIADADREAS